MKTIVINTETELKDFILENRKNIININGINFSELYPIIEVTKKHASYYDVDTQGNKYLHPPFNIKLNHNLVTNKEQDIMKTFYIVSKFKNGNKVCTGKLKATTRPADNLDYSYYDTEEEARKQNKF